MGLTVLFLFASCAAGALGYMPHLKEHYLTNSFLSDVVNKMGKDLALAADAFLRAPDINRMSSGNVLANRVIKGLENGEMLYPIDFETLSDNPSPSLRDREYLQHSSLWGHQFMAGGAGEGKQRLKPDGSVRNQQQVKSDAALPAYCNPPNPCPLGYSAVDGCLVKFENTAAFSRQYQASQECMCDSEHMFECPSPDFQSNGNEVSNNIDLDRIMDELSVQDRHKNLVAKKFHVKKNGNPYLSGEKLPVAAKKGNNLLSY